MYVRLHIKAQYQGEEIRHGEMLVLETNHKRAEICEEVELTKLIIKFFS
jgi:hypothetical protein